MNLVLRWVLEFLTPRHTKTSLVVLSLTVLLTILFEPAIWSTFDDVFNYFATLPLIPVLLFGVVFPGYILLGLTQSFLYLFNIRFLSSRSSGNVLSLERSAVELFALFALILLMMGSFISALANTGKESWFSVLFWYVVVYQVVQMFLCTRDLVMTRHIDFDKPLSHAERIAIVLVVVSVYGFVYTNNQIPALNWYSAAAASLIIWNLVDQALLRLYRRGQYWFLYEQPIGIQLATGIAALAIGGTAVLIVVNVVLDLIRRLDAQVSLREN